MRKLVCALIVAFSANAGNAALIFTAPLSGSNEVPPNGSPGMGFATVTLQNDMVTLDVSETFSGLLTNTVAAHLHCCAPPGVNAPVVLPFNTFPLGVTSGTFSHSFNLNTDLSGINPATFVTGLENGQVYANIHTTQFPGGEIRGQLELVPEPLTLILVGSCLVGLAGAGWIRRKRVNRR